jgi:hypothetical protein
LLVAVVVVGLETMKAAPAVEQVDLEQQPDFQ